jgi:hypothetical protein
MSNYIIEGNFDFYKELYESLDDSDDNNNNDNNNNNNNNNIDESSAQVCLITNTHLTKHFVELECKHAFNYVPLFKDLVNHKTKFSSLDTHRLKVNEIRCPYCRNKQGNLLPYIEELGLPKEHGVNWINMELMSTSNVVDLKIGQCCWGNGNECYAIHVLTNGSTNLDYCYYHYKLTARKLLMAQKLKQKLEAKALAAQVKAQAKAEEKQKKLDAKNELKSAKAIEKANKKKGSVVANTDENVVLSASLCQAILKSGPRKGEACGSAVKINNCCTRHGKVVEIM